jgi:hypothetical protein
MAHVAQLVEHVLGKDEVTRSIRVVGSRLSLIDGALSAWRAIGYTVGVLTRSVTYGEGEI